MVTECALLKYELSMLDSVRYSRTDNCDDGCVTNPGIIGGVPVFRRPKTKIFVVFILHSSTNVKTVRTLQNLDALRSPFCKKQERDTRNYKLSAEYPLKVDANF